MQHSQPNRLHICNSQSQGSLFAISCAFLTVFSQPGWPSLIPTHLYHTDWFNSVVTSLSPHLILDLLGWATCVFRESIICYWYLKLALRQNSTCSGMVRLLIRQWATLEEPMCWIFISVVSIIPPALSYGFKTFFVHILVIYLRQIIITCRYILPNVRHLACIILYDFPNHHEIFPLHDT